MSVGRCISIAVIRIEDRTTLARFDADQALLDIKPPIAFDWKTVSNKVATAAVNRTRLQLDLVSANDISGTPSPKIPSSPAHFGNAHGYQIHAVVSRPKNIAVAAICNSHASSRTAFVLCDTALAQFERMFLERASSLTETQCSSSFVATLEDAVTKFNSAMTQVSDTDNRVDKVKEAVAQTKETVLENIDRALDRGQKIESIVAASADLSENAETFSRQATNLEREMWWRNMKQKLMIGGIAAAVILVIVLLACGKKCVPFSGSSDSGKKDQ